MSTLYPDSEALPARERTVLNLYLVSTLMLFILLMAFGLAMRLAQGAWIAIAPNIFYQIMTAHGAGMVGTVGLASSAVMWFFLRKYVRLSLPMFVANYVFFMLGAALLLGATFIGQYAGAWTFLYPLPVHSMGVWTVGAAAVFMLGYLLIGVGFLLFYLDAMRAVIRVYGNLGRALGLQWLFGGTIDKAHPGTVVASTMVIIVNSLGILGGAVVLVMSLVNAYVPDFVLSALFTKNLIYFFGHVFINSSIYMAVIGVYELLPRYTGRPWSVSRPFLWAWAANTVLVLIVFPHHLLMDFAMPRWAMVIGQVASHAEGLPVFAVIAYGALTNIYRSGLRWRMPSMLVVLAMFGWAAGIVPAIIDGTISVNRVMHNTLWVPGHFHFYLLLGVLPMLLAFMYHLIGERADRPDRGGDRLGLAVYLLGGLTFVSMFLAGGHASEPRRYAVHFVEWRPYDRVASIGAVLVISAMLLFAVRICHGLLKAPAEAPRFVERDRRADGGLRTSLASAALLLAGGVALAAATRRISGVHHRDGAPGRRAQPAGRASGGGAREPIRCAIHARRSSGQVAAGGFHLHAVPDVLHGARRRLRAARATTGGPDRPRQGATAEHQLRPHAGHAGATGGVSGALPGPRHRAGRRHGRSPPMGCARSRRRSASPSFRISSAATRTTRRFTSWIPRVAWWTSSTWATWIGSGRPSCGISAGDEQAVVIPGALCRASRSGVVGAAGPPQARSDHVRADARPDSAPGRSGMAALPRDPCARPGESGPLEPSRHRRTGPGDRRLHLLDAAAIARRSDESSADGRGQVPVRAAPDRPAVRGELAPHGLRRQRGIPSGVRGDLLPAGLVVSHFADPPVQQLCTE